MELLIYTAILSIVVVLVSNILISLSKSDAQSQAKSEVNSSVRFVGELLRQDIKSASVVSIPSINTPDVTLSLTRRVDGKTIIYQLVGNVLTRKEGDDPEVNITNSNIVVSNPVFTRIENTNQVFDTKNISIKTSLVSPNLVCRPYFQVPVNVYSLMICAGRCSKSNTGIDH
jgi:hypothetical protein